MQIGRAVRIIAQVAVTAGLIGYLLWRTDPSAVVDALRHADWWLVPVAVLCVAASKLMHGIRWWLLIRHAGKVPLRAAILTLLAAVGLGVLLPFRAGAALQVQVLHRRYGIDRAAVAGSLMGEGVLDAVLVLMLVLVAVPLLGLQRGVVEGALGGAAVMAVLAGTVAMLGSQRAQERWFRWLPERIRGTVQRGIANLRLGMKALGRPQTAWLLLLPTMGDWLLATTAHNLVGRAFGLGVPVYSYLAVEIIGNASTALPLTAGSIGPYEVAARETLVLFGADGNRAALFALATHACILIAEASDGLLALWALGLRKKDLW